MAGTKSDAVRIALSYLGSGYHHFCSSFWGGCFAWCAAFSSVVMKEAGVEAPWSTSCTSQRSTWRSMGRWYTDKNMAVGDMLYYDWDRTGDCDHVGIITAISSDGTLQVTEGNFGDAPSSVTKVTNRYIKRTYPYICGYARPRYANEKEHVVLPNTPTTDKTIYAQISNGVNGNIVYILQGLLEMNGCTVKGIDGKFGRNTESAVKQYQSNKGLSVDGIVGPKTWGALKKTPMPQIMNGSKGNAVYVAQAMLDLLGTYPKWIDGEFGPKTKAATEKYQRSKSLGVDGIIGPKTWASLMSE
jgi:hypothetical protein